MPKRTTIYIPDEVSTALGEPDNLSSRIACIVDRHRQFVGDNMPAMSVGEWCAVMDANNGTDWIVPVSPTMLWANVADSVGLGDKWEIDQAALVAHMQSLSVSQLLAISEVCHRFWAVPTRSGTHEECLRACEARISS